MQHRIPHQPDPGPVADGPDRLLRSNTAGSLRSFADSTTVTAVPTPFGELTDPIQTSQKTAPSFSSLSSKTDKVEHRMLFKDATLASSSTTSSAATTTEGPTPVAPRPRTIELSIPLQRPRRAASTAGGSLNGGETILPVHNRQDTGISAASLETSDSSVPARMLRARARTFTIRAAGESGRSGFHPISFFWIAWRSSSTVSKFFNILWPMVPVSIVLSNVKHKYEILNFIFAYIALIPCANLISFAGSELAHKVPHTLGMLIDTTLGSVTEVILFIVLLSHGQYVVIQAAILGSILATMLLCLGLCFFVGGLRHEEQEFDDNVTEAGSGLLLAGGVALAVPSLFFYSNTGITGVTAAVVAQGTLQISRIVSIVLIIAYIVFVWFQARYRHGLFDTIFQDDEKKITALRRLDKFTLTEALVCLAISIGLVAYMSINVVSEIPFMVENYSISDAFLGLILVPVLEKAAEHLSAVEESWDNRTNTALSHVLNATLQTALFNGPLTVIIGWCLHADMDFKFAIFDIVTLLLAIITVGGFLRDQKSNYLEGFLCLCLYAAIAISAWYTPTADKTPT